MWPTARTDPVARGSKGSVLDAIVVEQIRKYDMCVGGHMKVRVPTP